MHLSPRLTRNPGFLGPGGPQILALRALGSSETLGPMPKGSSSLEQLKVHFAELTPGPAPIQGRSESCFLHILPPVPPLSAECLSSHFPRLSDSECLQISTRASPTRFPSIHLDSTHPFQHMSSLPGLPERC